MKRHKAQDPSMDNVALFGGAHVRKGSGIYMWLYPQHINEHASIYTCMYSTWEVSIILDIEVCGCYSACIYVQYGDCELV